MTEFGIMMLALVAWREARGEGLEGMLAVMCVVRNRVLARWGGWIEVMIQKNQFHSMIMLGDSQTVLWPTDSSFEAVLKLAHEVHDGRTPDVTDGSLYYANMQTATSSWFAKNIATHPDHPKRAEIGKHTFFA